MKPTSMKIPLSDVQGKLFVMSGKAGYDSARFIRNFMNSRIAAGMDSDYDFSQWAGKEYLFEWLQDEYPQAFAKTGKVFDTEVLYWTGYLYRYWNFHTNESSKQIYRQASAKTMNEMYWGFHTLDTEHAIDRLKLAGMQNSSPRF